MQFPTHVFCKSMDSVHTETYVVLIIMNVAQWCAAGISVLLCMMFGPVCCLSFLQAWEQSAQCLGLPQREGLHTKDLLFRTQCAPFSFSTPKNILLLGERTAAKGKKEGAHEGVWGNWAWWKSQSP